MKRKTFTPDLKAKVAITALKGHQTTNEIAQEFGVHPTQINTGKKQLLESSSDVFGKGGQAEARGGLRGREGNAVRPDWPLRITVTLQMRCSARVRRQLLQLRAQAALRMIDAPIKLSGDLYVGEK